MATFAEAASARAGRDLTAYDEVVKAINTPELREIWANNGSEIALMKQADFARFLNSEIKRWATVTKASGAKLD